MLRAFFLRPKVTVARLIEEFSVIIALPVEVDHIEAALRRRGITDEFYCWEDVDLPSDHMRGYVERWDWEDKGAGTKTLITDITYGHMPNEYARLVCGKELLHVLDPDGSKVQTEEEIKRQIAKIVLSPELQDVFNDTAHVITDRVAVIQALAILFPLAARNALLQAYTEKKVSLRKIAQRAELPVNYVAMVMSEFWPSLHDHLLKQPV